MEIVQEKITVPADRSRLAGLRADIRKLCAESGVEPKTTQRLVLTVDEAISNVMEHSQSNGNNPIEISLEIGDETIVVDIRDHGIAFNPCAHLKKVCPLGTNGKKFSKRGFGLYLIHLIADNISYNRTENSENLLTITIGSTNLSEKPTTD